MTQLSHFNDHPSLKYTRACEKWDPIRIGDMIVLARYLNGLLWKRFKMGVVKTNSVGIRRVFEDSKTEGFRVHQKLLGRQVGQHLRTHQFTSSGSCRSELNGYPLANR